MRRPLGCLPMPQRKEAPRSERSDKISSLLPRRGNGLVCNVWRTSDSNGYLYKVFDPTSGYCLDKGSGLYYEPYAIRIIRVFVVCLLQLTHDPLSMQCVRLVLGCRPFVSRGCLCLEQPCRSILSSSAVSA
jgi:hypothetical protein